MSSTSNSRRWRGKSQLTGDEERRKNWCIDVHNSDWEERSTKEALYRPRNCGDKEAGVEIHEPSTVRLEGRLPQRYNFNELSEATGGFSEESILGHGGFGVVYLGQLKSRTQVAIKRMNREATQRQGMREFESEMQIVSQVSHRNLIKLRGFCADGELKEYMLVYDLMPNGSLDDALFNSAKGTTFLSWPQKFKILSGAADGLSYLHQGLDEQVIHRDIKCSNILLDKGMNGKLGDFGIARMVAHQGRAATTDMAGTLGYIAPEVFSENQFTDKADVFAFGVVVLEVACGRRVFGPSADHKMGLVQWVSLAHSKRYLLSTVDKRDRDDDPKQIRRVLKVGLLCTLPNRRDRPSMRSVVQMLAGDVKVPSIPNSKATSFHSSLKNLFKMVSSGWVSRSQTITERDESLRVIDDSHSLTDRSPCVSTSKSVSPGLVSRSRQILNVDSPSTSSASGIINESPYASTPELVSPGLVSRSRQILNVDSPSTSSASGITNESPYGSTSKSVSPGLVSRSRQIGYVESTSTSSARGTAANSGLRMDFTASNSGLRMLDVVKVGTGQMGSGRGLVSRSRSVAYVESPSTSSASGTAANSGQRMDFNANNSGLRMILDVVRVGTGQMGSGRLLAQSDYKEKISYREMVEQEWTLPPALQ